MKKIFFLLLLAGVGFFAKAQTNPFPSTDSLERFINRYIRNSPVEAFQNLRMNTSLIGMLRFIQNSELGSGLDTAYKLNDSTIRLITFEPDTFDVTLRFAGSGSTNTNVGSGFRWAVVHTNQIKTAVAGYGTLIDSTSTANSLRFRADTSGTNGLVTRTELLDSTDITTQVESPIYVKLRSSWPVPDTLAIDTTRSTTRAWLYKVADSLIVLMASSGVANTNLGAGFRWLVPSSQGIKTAENTATVTWDSVGTNTLRATVPDNAITDAKLRQSAARSVIGRSANSTGNVADITGTTNQVLRVSSDGTTLGFGAVNLASTSAVTGELPNANIDTFSPFPAQRTYGKIYEKNFWNNNAEDLQVGPTGSNTTTVSAGQIQLAATTFNGAHIVNIIPGRVSCLNKSTITAQFQLNTLSATTFELGLKINSIITHSGAQFGYMGFVQTTSSGTGSLFLYDQGRSSSKATSVPGFTFATNDIIELVLDLRDTSLVFTAQNLTTDPTGASKKTITYNFTPNSSAHILPNSYNWAVYDGNGGSGVRTLRYVKIESNDVQYPNLLILGNSKTKIGYATFWNGRFGMQLNATYPSVVINAGGAERLSDMMLRLDEITALSPSQVLLADIASNSIRAGIPIADVVYQYRYIVSRLEGAGIRVLHMILPEDSTAGGLGQTAWHARLSTEYPSTYIASVYNDMSTNNIADAGMIHADGIHLVQAGNDQVTASIIASGLVQTISTQRRSEIRTSDGWIMKTGDSLHFRDKIFSKHNYVPRWDHNNNSLTTGIQGMDSTQFWFSMSSRPTKPLSSLLGWVEGAFGISGIQGGEYVFGRDNSAQYYARYVNLNTMYTNVSGSDVKYMGADGRESWGNQASVSSSIIPSTINIKRSGTFTGLFARKGMSFSSDSVTFTHSGSTALGDRSINSFHKAQMSATGSTSYDTLATVHIEGPPYAGSNVAINFPLALEIVAGRLHAGGAISSLNSPSGYGAYRLMVKNPDSVEATIPASTFATQSALNDTAAAIRAAGGGGADGNGIYSGSGALSGNTDVTGGSANSLNLGTSGSKLSALTANSATSISLTASAYVQLLGGVQISGAVATDANYTIPDNVSYITLPQITADRNVTMPQQGPGKMYIIHNKNVSANSWNVVGNLVNAAGTAITTITNVTVYIIISDGTNFIQIN